MLIGVAAETDPAETRVAASPETVKKFIALGAEVAVEHGAGLKAGVVDAEYRGGGRATGFGGRGARRRRRAQSAPAEPQPSSRRSSAARSSSR